MTTVFQATRFDNCLLNLYITLALIIIITRINHLHEIYQCRRLDRPKLHEEVFKFLERYRYTNSMETMVNAITLP